MHNEEELKLQTTRAYENHLPPIRSYVNITATFQQTLYTIGQGWRASRFKQSKQPNQTEGDETLGFPKDKVLW